jgi:nicotinamide-nucleotide amidase
MLHTETLEQVKRLADVLLREKLWAASAESCTGGLIAAACTELPGSSAWFKGGIVSYSNAAKTTLLNVAPQSIITHGAVSEAVVLSMVRGAQAALDVECAMAVSGIAGPDGGTPEKPVGLVWIAVAKKEYCTAHKFLFSGNRADIRTAAVQAALASLLDLF